MHFFKTKTTAIMLYYFSIILLPKNQAKIIFLRKILMCIEMINLAVLHLPQREDHGKRYFAARVEARAEDS